MSAATLSESLMGLSTIVEHESGAVRVVDLEVELPVEVIWRRTNGIDEFVVTAPRWRWRTDFDREPGRMYVSFEGVRS